MPDGREVVKGLLPDQIPLVLHGPVHDHSGWTPNLSSAPCARPPPRLIPMPVLPKQVADIDMNYHGDLEIHGSARDDYFVRYAVRFTHGAVEWIRRLDELPELHRFWLMEKGMGEHDGRCRQGNRSAKNQQDHGGDSSLRLVCPAAGGLAAASRPGFACASIPDADLDRFHGSLARHDADALNAGEQEELERYLFVNCFVELMRDRAKLSLDNATADCLLRAVNNKKAKRLWSRQCSCSPPSPRTLRISSCI